MRYRKRVLVYRAVRYSRHVLVYRALRYFRRRITQQDQLIIIVLMIVSVIATNRDAINRECRPDGLDSGKFSGYSHVVLLSFLAAV
jgi:hypothetical protein